MSAKKLNRKLTLETLVQVADGAGGYSESWIQEGELWADVRAGSGREKAGVSTPLSYVPWKITVRSAPAGASNRPRPDQRFREGQRIFRITAVAEADSDGRYLICHATEEVSV